MTTSESPSSSNPIVVWCAAVNDALRDDAPRVTQAMLVQACGVSQSYLSGYWHAPDPWKARPLTEEKRLQIHRGAVKIEKTLARKGLLRDGASLPGGISAEAVDAYNTAVYAARQASGRSMRQKRAA